MFEQANSSSDRLVIRPHASPTGDVLVTVLLRGGMDALYTIPPLGDPGYAAQRAGFDASAGKGKPTNLDDFFSLHPDFAPLVDLYRRGLMAIVHACGPTEALMSHFDAMRLLEHGAASSGQTDGWLGRYLQAQTDRAASPFRAIALGPTVPLVLRGVTGSRALDSLEDLRLQVPLDWPAAGFMTALKRLHATGGDPLSAAGRGTLATLAEVERLSSTLDDLPQQTLYPPTALMLQLHLVARLIRSSVGLEAAVLSLGGWDTHLTQIKSIERPMYSLASGLRTFVDALGDHIQRVTIVVLSEFGRRVAPNGAGGTDHGRASAAFVIGGNIHGGKVYSRWPGVHSEALDDDGNLAVTTDFRDVLAEILDRRLGGANLAHIFPDFKPNYLNFTAI